MPKFFRCGVLVVITLVAFISLPKVGAGQKTEALKENLQQRIVPDNQSLEDIRRFARSRVSPVPEPASADEWQQFAAAARQRVLDTVVFRGPAASWRDADTSVVLTEIIEGGPGYRIQKLRYEALPDLWIPALMYLPEILNGRHPVFLNVNGHDAVGKAAAYKQARCIHMARHGIIALNTEWFGMGQLRSDGYSHGRLNQLDLCGASGIAPFYLAMSRGLDLLLAHPNADPERVGVAGLSGGGWQTILISSLDTRVTLTNPVAGYSGLLTRIDNFSDLGDSEQTPVDLSVTGDYQVLTALLAPRSALLTFNEKDDCCFASGHALPPLVAAAQPVYQLLGQPERLRTHVNSDPGTHNFLVDNRQALYRMIRDQWYAGSEAAFATVETATEAEQKTAEQLNVPLPDDNLTFRKLASAIATDLPHTSTPPASSPERTAWREALVARLRETVKPKTYPVVAETVREETIATADAPETRIVAWQLKLGEDWTIPLCELSRGNPARAAIVISDQGRAAASSQIEVLLADGYRVFAFDPWYFGELQIKERAYLWALIVSTVGERPLGVQCGQVQSVAEWIRNAHKISDIAVVTHGPRTSVIGLTAAALDRSLFSTVTTHEPLENLRSLIETNASFEQSPELFCFGLLDVADLPQLRELAGK